MTSQYIIYSVPTVHSYNKQTERPASFRARHRTLRVPASLAPQTFQLIVRAVSTAIVLAVVDVQLRREHRGSDLRPVGRRFLVVAPERLLHGVCVPQLAGAEKLHPSTRSPRGLRAARAVVTPIGDFEND
uniref:Uncharacterized protein n=1 Tax=Timema bartmani TaxID=61472 RepID=A0A7R9HW59_9NEOP|nr:unnamed protein product [Timema bartmani]